MSLSFFLAAAAAAARRELCLWAGRRKDYTDGYTAQNPRKKRPVHVLSRVLKEAMKCP